MEQNPPEPPTQANQTSPDQSPPTRRLHHKLNIFAGKEKIEIGVLIVLLIGVAAAAFYFGKLTKHSKPAASQTVTQQVAVASPSPTTSTKPQLPDATFLSGNTYLDSPKKLGDLDFLKNYKLFCDPATTKCDSSTLDINYYQIGATAKGQPIIAMSFLDGPGGDSYAYAIETQSGVYTLLAQNDYDPADFASTWQASLNPNVTIDEKTKLNDVTMPLQLTVSNQKVKAAYAPDGATSVPMDIFKLMKNGLASIRGGYSNDVSPSNIKQFGSQGYIDFYEVTASDTANYKVIELYGAYKQLFSTQYYPAGEIASATGNVNINWSSGAKNQSEYFSAGQGCGTGYVIAKNVVPASLIRVGTSPQGQVIYQLPQTNALVQEIYTKDYQGDQQYLAKSLQNLSLTQFSQQHGYFLAQNGLGEYVLFLRSDMIVHGGCAKPVIYLYPQHTEQVSVKVGARVVNSLPAYGSGWQGVLASPDGQLKYDGETYDSLFWDGYGYGSYPDIESGTIVSTKDVVNTVRQQLYQQGLRGQEITDFMNYWQPKLQAINQPYIRLTWLNTAQMNGLAPLDINPHPQTLIRVFLDFEGVAKPYSLKPQVFWSPARKGFTVIEWGGLSRNGLD